MRQIGQKNEEPAFDAKQIAKDWLKIDEEETSPDHNKLIESLAFLLEGVFAEGLHIGTCLKTMQVCQN
jgi:hypothetical protein